MSENSTNEGPQVNVDMSKAEAQRKRRLANGRAFIERRIATLMAEAAVLAAEYDVAKPLFDLLATNAYENEARELHVARALAVLDLHSEEKADDK